MSRPSDAQDDFRPAAPEAGDAVSPALGPAEWLRWAWRQITSMRTALLLLLALAVAAVPGSLIPQQSADPNGVAAFRQDNPGLVKVVEALQGFTVYTSFWFSAIYLLLFVSLVGCVVPRISHHLRSLRAAPPRTPSRFDRLPARSSARLGGTTGAAALDAAERLLRRRRYRVVRYGSSVSAERGYLRETGNLLFHTALLGVLVSVFIGGGFTYTGQKVLSAGQTFVNSQTSYDSFNPGRFFSDDSLAPYSLTLDRLDVRYEQQNPNALGQPIDYTAHVTTRLPGRAAEQHVIKVNEPLGIDGTQVYLLGNGYSAKVTVTSATGVVTTQTVPFRPQTPQNVSLGVIKVPDTGDRTRQIGMTGFLYPTVVKDANGSLDSLFPSLGDPLVSLNVYEGDLGLDTGEPKNVYVLDTDAMTEVAGIDSKSGTLAIQLRPGQTKTLPDGLGTVRLDGVVRFAGLDIHHDPSQSWVALFVALAVLGLITSLLVPRRRMWVRVTEDPDGGVDVEYAALARGDDPGLDAAIADLEGDHRRALGAEAAEPVRV